jgi:hypothetical protein
MLHVDGSEGRKHFIALGSELRDRAKDNKVR